jgi:hypothetical protein
MQKPGEPVTEDSSVTAWAFCLANSLPAGLIEPKRLATEVDTSGGEEPATQMFNGDPGRLWVINCRRGTEQDLDDLASRHADVNAQLAGARREIDDLRLEQIFGIDQGFHRRAARDGDGLPELASRPHIVKSAADQSGFGQNHTVLASCQRLLRPMAQPLVNWSGRDMVRGSDAVMVFPF